MIGAKVPDDDQFMSRSAANGRREIVVSMAIETF
jgi:hypothetical protein